MSWLNEQVSLYPQWRDNIGKPVTMREIIYTVHGIPHDWYEEDENGWKVGNSADITTICQLRALDKESPDYQVQSTKLKSRLQCYTPSGLLATKARGQVKEISRTGLLQFDFDDYDNCEDVEYMKKLVFELPFIAFCGKSCRKGFYALALIAEPYRLEEYAIHCFEVFKKWGINVDRSKGRNVQDLRYVSYDSNMLVREYPIPLKTTHFRREAQPPKFMTKGHYRGSNEFVQSKLLEISKATIGNRFETVQKNAFALGCTGEDVLQLIVNEICNNPQFKGVERKYIKIAQDCYKAGTLKQPI